MALNWLIWSSYIWMLTVVFATFIMMWAAILLLIETYCISLRWTQFVDVHYSFTLGRVWGWKHLRHWGNSCAPQQHPNYKTAVSVTLSSLWYVCLSFLAGSNSFVVGQICILHLHTPMHFTNEYTSKLILNCTSGAALICYDLFVTEGLQAQPFFYSEMDRVPASTIGGGNSSQIQRVFMKEYPASRRWATIPTTLCGDVGA